MDLFKGAAPDGFSLELSSNKYGARCCPTVSECSLPPAVFKPSLTASQLWPSGSITKGRRTCEIGERSQVHKGNRYSRKTQSLQLVARPTHNSYTDVTELSESGAPAGCEKTRVLNRGDLGLRRSVWYGFKSVHSTVILLEPLAGHAVRSYEHRLVVLRSSASVSFP